MWRVRFPSRYNGVQPDDITNIIVSKLMSNPLVEKDLLAPQEEQLGNPSNKSSTYWSVNMTSLVGWWRTHERELQKAEKEFKKQRRQHLQKEIMNTNPN